MPAVSLLSSSRDTDAPQRGGAAADKRSIPAEDDSGRRRAEFQRVALREQQQATAPRPHRTVRVKAGETFSGIAAAKHLPKRALYRANPHFDPQRADGVLHYDRSTDGGWDPDYLRPGD